MTSPDLSPQVQKYFDLWNSLGNETASLRAIRKSDIQKVVSVEVNRVKILSSSGSEVVSFPKPQTILEIGSGMGNVTAAYKSLFTDASIIALDADPRAASPAADLSVPFIQKDALELSTADLQEIATSMNSEKIDHIVALKTAGEVVLHLATLLNNQKSRELSIFVSIIVESDQQHLDEINRALKNLVNHRALKLYLHEGRDYYELGWVIVSN